MEADRDGCHSDQVRVQTDLVDICIDIYEAPGFGSAPLGLSENDALTYCRERGRRLCSEQEWESACRGPDGHLYPYGDSFSTTACVVGEGTASAVGSRNACRSGYGAYDMSGNAAEWVSGPLIKGGDFASDDFGSRCGARSRAGASELQLVSVRCCSSPG